MPFLHAQFKNESKPVTLEMFTKAIGSLEVLKRRRIKALSLRSLVVIK